MPSSPPAPPATLSYASADLYNPAFLFPLFTISAGLCLAFQPILLAISGWPAPDHHTLLAALLCVSSLAGILVLSSGVIPHLSHAARSALLIGGVSLFVLLNLASPVTSATMGFFNVDGVWTAITAICMPVEEAASFVVVAYLLLSVPARPDALARPFTVGQRKIIALWMSILGVYHTLIFGGGGVIFTFLLYRENHITPNTQALLYLPPTLLLALAGPAFLISAIATWLGRAWAPRLALITWSIIALVYLTNYSLQFSQIIRSGITLSAVASTLNGLLYTWMQLTTWFIPLWLLHKTKAQWLGQLPVSPQLYR